MVRNAYQALPVASLPEHSCNPGVPTESIGSLTSRPPSSELGCGMPRPPMEGTGAWAPHVVSSTHVPDLDGKMAHGESRGGVGGSPCTPPHRQESDPP